MKVKIKKVLPNAVIPSYAKPGDAGLDLTACDILYDGTTNTTKVDFGIALEIPDGYVGLIFSRSSIYKKGTTLSNSVGVIDSQYRGSIQARFIGLIQFEEGERAAQLIIMPYTQVEFAEVDELSETERGEGGFGSTN
ncbi:MAG: dUTP diphosphatase [Richelia sp. RM2_1_2]|nr:dUTP diphosphatase [Richelia sp. RM2_1_2]